MYSTAQEIDDGLAALAAAHPATAQLITVPHSTHGGRAAHVLRIGTGPGAGTRDAIAILGGVHAREWVPPEACLALAADLLGAYADGDGLAYGGAVFDAAQVRALVESLDLYVFACVNPDGREHSQTVAPLWRKNRRPGSGGGCPGVDLNRNFDFLWDHTAHFAADAGVATSSNPCHDTYRGPSVASEPETQNVVWLVDSFNIRWLIDVHSAVPVVLHSWGSDTNQGIDPDMTFRNPAYDAVRGRVGDAIGEYITATDGSAAVALAQEMAAGALAVRGTAWPVEQAMTLYPTSGASDDYAYSRHFTDATRRRVLGWTIECGSSFQPPWSEAEQVAAETCAALLRFATAARRLTDGVSVTLQTSTLAISAEEATTSASAVVLEVAGAVDVVFEIDPPAGFDAPLGTVLMVAAPGFGVTTTARLWVSCMAGPAGSTATGVVAVRCPTTGQRWQVPVTATSLPRTTTALVLALDKSGSMTEDAGDGRSRIQVLREAASVLVSVIGSEDGVGVVAFDHAASALLPVTVAGPEVFGPGRAAALAAVAGHAANPTGLTSIGDGVLAAQALLAGVDIGPTGTYRQGAVVVLTDGRENAPAMIADVTVGQRTFAIGLGTPAAVDPLALATLTGGHGGYVTVTGELSVDERFLLAQYLLQVLAGATNAQIVLG